jgi:NAD(P)-dependent dehydrogenase (short-subunit alcohol dehydrogenase family)
MSRIDRYFAGKKAAISGAGDGIGRALALRLNAAGCDVWLCDLNEAKLSETAGLLDHDRAKVITRIVDCGNRDELFAWAEAVAADAPAIDALFNNAGVGYGARFEDSTEDNFKWLIDINFWGVVHATRAFLPLLKQSERAHLVNISSIFGMVGIPTQSAYNAAKFAVRGFSEALQAEYQNASLVVSCVHPGGIQTNIARSARIDGTAQQMDADERDAQFRQLARTSPDRAAKIILNGTAKAKPRIMVGWDAWLILQLTKILPTRYHWITARVADDR